jgi:hypothetical protein
MPCNARMISKAATQGAKQPQRAWPSYVLATCRLRMNDAGRLGARRPGNHQFYRVLINEPLLDKL